jgi:hypothetical protein
VPVSRGPKSTIRWKSARTCAGDGSGTVFDADAARAGRDSANRAPLAAADEANVSAAPRLIASRLVIGIAAR